MPAPKQASLFDDDATRSTSVTQVLAQRKPADRAEATFHRLVKQLEQKRAALRAWQDYALRFDQRVANEVLPLQREYRQAQRQMVFLCDQTLRTKALRGKQQKAKLIQLIRDIAQAVLQEEEDTELEALYDRHSPVSHAEGLAKNIQSQKTIIEQMTGIDLGEIEGATNFEDFLTGAGRKIREKAAQMADDAPPRSKRRPSAKAEAAQEKREQAAKDVSQTVRDIYRKLASALHPDRETDPLQRAHKTAQMQRVNQAYEAGDLLALLNLQLEIEQIDAEHVSTLPRERLAHYNRVLREQLAELEAEIEAVVMPFRFSGSTPHFGAFTPEQIDRSLSADIARLRADVRQLKAELEEFRNPASLAKVLKQVQIEPEPDPLDEFFDLGALDEPFYARAPWRPKR